ncbi:AbrB/MazE/SpoVT family DNA-binding domain-containing protein [Candidatus Giovannonibacteria bacterium]|nr:AbrB/MazE/SpoVT family DNA-binding domain-containing protein [Candidatus Giovannonibacteria bacterium]
MTQKVLRVGSSAAVTIPKKSLEELGLKPGDEVIVELDRKSRKVSIRPSQTMTKRQERIAELTLSFINRYRKDLEALAKK